MNFNKSLIYNLQIFLWGHLKDIVYSTPIHNVEILRRRIKQGCQQIWQWPGIWERVRQSMMRPALQLMVAILSTFCRGFHIRRKNCKL